ncbi:hypothetical protein F2P81_008354 [Scophthalmus maximus]|uniref:Uncharacterized protein n=1 Tax=Scophthalmus maximus TaxID=52904 RepID=A0A6A4T5B2_SCOMX|nr:hypothetical protein F2P81_008354 [Scophthalmus maximus]
MKERGLALELGTVKDIKVVKTRGEHRHTRAAAAFLYVRFKLVPDNRPESTVTLWTRRSASLWTTTDRNRSQKS